MTKNFECEVSKKYAQFVKKLSKDTVFSYTPRIDRKLGDIKTKELRNQLTTLLGYEEEIKESERETRREIEKQIQHNRYFNIIIWIILFLVVLVIMSITQSVIFAIVTIVLFIIVIWSTIFNLSDEDTILNIFRVAAPHNSWTINDNENRENKLNGNINNSVKTISQVSHELELRDEDDLHFIEYQRKKEQYTHVVLCPICNTNIRFDEYESIPFQGKCKACDYIFVVVSDTKKEKFYTFGPRGGKYYDTIEYDGIKAIKPKAQQIQYIDKSVVIDESVSINIKDSVIYKSSIVGRIEQNK